MKLIKADRSGFVPASHENPQAPGVFKRVIAAADQFQAGRVQMLNWARLPAGSSFQWHYHEDMQEVFVLVKGQALMCGAGQTLLMQAGDAVIVDAHEPHQMRNDQPEDAEYLVFGISSGQNGRTIVVAEPDKTADH